MQKTRFLRLFLIILVLNLFSGRLLAHGGGTLQVANAPVGDCLVSVWSAPTGPRTGTPLHITVGVAEAAAGEPVLDAEVLILVHSDEEKQPVTQVRATTEQSANKLFYEADLPALSAGTYQIEVATVCREVEEAVSFSLTVRPSTDPLLIVIPVILGLFLVGGLLWRSWRRREMARTPEKKRPGSR